MSDRPARIAPLRVSTPPPPRGSPDGVIVVAVDALGLDSVRHGCKNEPPVWRPMIRPRLLEVRGLPSQHVRHVGIELWAALRQPSKVAVLEDLSLFLCYEASCLGCGP